MTALAECDNKPFVGAKPIRVRVANNRVQSSRPGGGHLQSYGVPQTVSANNVHLAHSQHKAREEGMQSTPVAEVANTFSSYYSYQQYYTNTAGANQVAYYPGYPYVYCYQGANGFWPGTQPQHYYGGGDESSQYAQHQQENVAYPSFGTLAYVDHGQSRPVDVDKLNEEAIARNEVRRY